MTEDRQGEGPRVQAEDGGGKAAHRPPQAVTSASGQEIPNRGDVLLFHTDVSPRTVWQPSILFVWLIHVFTSSRWNHTALALGPDPATGVPMMVEATASRGVQVNPTRSRTDEMRIVRMAYDGNDGEDVLAYARRREGIRYGFLTAFMVGFRHVFPGALILKRGDQVICSELVAEALERAAFDWGKDSATVSPGDIAQKLGVPRQ
jgi:hypothetical protein